MASIDAHAGAVAPTGWRDSRAGYGIVSRVLHWTMAALFAWQFTSAFLHMVADDTPLADFFWSMHFNFGLILWALVLVRGAWGLANIGRRPSYVGPPVQRVATGVVHVALYVLMVTIPTLALLRSYGGTRGMRWFGLQVFDPQGQEIEWLVALGDNLHGELGWTLLALVAGHVTMALYHGFVHRDGVLQRMTRGDERAVARI